MSNTESSSKVGKLEFIGWFNNRQQTEILEYLKAHPDHLQFKHGETGLTLLSCQRNCPEVLRYVLERTKDDVNKNVKHWGTPLGCAVANGRPELARMLLEAGADPNAERAIVSSVTRKEPGRLDCLKLLLEHSADVNRLYSMFGSREHVRTVLDFAVGNEEAIKLLRAAGAKTSEELLRQNPNAEIEGVEE